MRPTSFRFDEDFLALIDAWAAHLSVGRRRRATRADVMHLALRRMKPTSAEPDPIHRAWNRLFGERP